MNQNVDHEAHTVFCSSLCNVGRSSKSSVWWSSAGNGWTELQSGYCRANFHSWCRNASGWPRDTSGGNGYPANWNCNTAAGNSDPTAYGHSAGDKSTKSEHNCAWHDYPEYKSERYESSRYNYTWDGFAKFDDAKQPAGRNSANYSASDGRYDAASINWQIQLIGGPKIGLAFCSRPGAPVSSPRESIMLHRPAEEPC